MANFAHILKDSEASRKAWLSRRRAAQKQKNSAAGKKAWETRRTKAATPFEVPTPKNRIEPTAKNKAQIAKMQEYMDGFSSKLKNPNEKAYVQERVKQMLSGVERPSGMSGKHGLTKQRAVQFEALTYKIFLAGRNKIKV